MSYDPVKFANNNIKYMSRGVEPKSARQDKTQHQHAERQTCHVTSPAL
jgi:hypothetical protein